MSLHYVPAHSHELSQVLEPISAAWFVGRLRAHPRWRSDLAERRRFPQRPGGGRRERQSGIHSTRFQCDRIDVYQSAFGNPRAQQPNPRKWRRDRPGGCGRRWLVRRLSLRRRKLEQTVPQSRRLEIRGYYGVSGCGLRRTILHRRSARRPGRRRRSRSAGQWSGSRDALFSE